jgi:hypothetical protein
MKYMQEHYGSGFIISGESGLSSIRSAGVDYLPFTSWGGETNPEKSLYSFKDIFKWLRTSEFTEKGYKWIGIDSLTELSDLSYKHAEEQAMLDAQKQGKKQPNGFEVWANHGAQMIGACKAIRDMQMHVIVTALAKENVDENGNNEYWPMVAGKSTMQQLPGIFDCVFCGVRASVEQDGRQKVLRYLISDEVRGWHGKVRDEHHVIQPIEKTGNLVELLARLDEADKK